MAFAGLNVTFGYIKMFIQHGIAPIYGPASLSNNMSSPGTSNVAAPPNPDFETYQPMASVYSSADAWITVGPGTPPDPSVDSTTSGRRFIPANNAIDFFCSVGDKVRWALA